jgi:hypothetical protein
MKKTVLSLIKNDAPPQDVSFPFPMGLLDKNKKRVCASKTHRKSQGALPGRGERSSVRSAHA